MSTAANPLTELAEEVADMISDRLLSIVSDAELLPEPAPGHYWGSTTAEAVAPGAYALYLVQRANHAATRAEGARTLTIVVGVTPDPTPREPAVCGVAADDAGDEIEWTDDDPRWSR